MCQSTTLAAEALVCVLTESLGYSRRSFQEDQNRQVTFSCGPTMAVHGLIYRQVMAGSNPASTSQT